ncbi:MAG: tRNA 2-thiouridine(34) synthase MnmA [Puniceicoccales bacterium]|jgi:tRNA-specific 2-thiouridylase|nr:tRNA 2-thiouridine(34) synthase MnmA [Puniceicoccales bacterium]
MELDSIFVAMSGGVDSSVAAWLLKERKKNVAGGYMRTWHNGDANNPLSHCPWRQDLESASRAADEIGVDFEIIDMIENYRKFVVRELIDGYKNSLTPNPDVMCNRFIKFGALYSHVARKGFSKMATGHYCRKHSNADGSFDLKEAVDKTKDQSYFLAYLSQEQLAIAEFPLGDMTKAEVRKIARAAGLANAERKDSQGICFLGDVKIQNFLSQYIEENPGDIVDDRGNRIGRHLGLHNFTLGQRRGINVPSNSDFNHYVVVDKDSKHNRLVVAFESPMARNLYGKRFMIRDLSYINRVIESRCKLLAKPRYRDPSQRIYFERVDATMAVVEFEEPQRALANGQVIAFYDGEVLLGGGIYDKKI